MEWIERLNQTINYIEEHLTEEIDYEQLAKVACCSTYHFQRMFGYMAGVSLAEYIRRRRMSLAAVDLLAGDEKIVDLGLKYGYASPTAFNRAFQSVHGMAPSAVKKSGANVKSYPPISFKITVKGVEEMNYRACGEAENWKYFIAVVSSAPAVDGLEEYTIPASTWAIFSGSGTNLSIQELERRIITEWLPTSGYEYGNAPDVEVYLNPDPANAQFEVWVPVIKK